MNAAYHSIIDQFQQSKVLVIGDIILDAYLKGDSSRLSPEAPVPVVNIARKEEAVGGAANIALNLRALGADVTFFSAVGSDDEAERAIGLLQRAGVRTDAILKEAGRKTMVKTRVMVKNTILARFDYGTQVPISQATEQLLSQFLNEQFHQFDLIMVGDYYGGILTPSIIHCMEQLQEAQPKLLAVDSK